MSKKTTHSAPEPVSALASVVGELFSIRDRLRLTALMFLGFEDIRGGRAVTDYDRMIARKHLEAVTEDLEQILDGILTGGGR